MSDRELLKFAAKAMHNLQNSHFCNYTVVNEEVGVCLELGSHRGAFTRYWNPLTNDGDALRLAVSLLIQVVQDRMGFVKVGWSVGFDSGTPSMDGRGPWYLKEWLSDHSGDRQAATRRAIVRAAAEIGRSNHD